MTVGNPYRISRNAASHQSKVYEAQKAQYRAETLIDAVLKVLTDKTAVCSPSWRS